MASNYHKIVHNILNTFVIYTLEHNQIVNYPYPSSTY